MIEECSGALAIMASVVITFHKFFIKKEQPKLTQIIIVTMSAFTVPYALILIFFSYLPENFVPEIEDLRLTMIIAGIALLYVSIKKIADIIKSNTP